MTQDLFNTLTTTIASIREYMGQPMSNELMFTDDADMPAFRARISTIIEAESALADVQISMIDSPDRPHWAIDSRDTTWRRECIADDTADQEVEDAEHVAHLNAELTKANLTIRELELERTTMNSLFDVMNSLLSKRNPDAAKRIGDAFNMVEDKS